MLVSSLSVLDIFVHEGEQGVFLYLLDHNPKPRNVERAQDVTLVWVRNLGAKSA
jgi:hypothetical protein